MHIKTLMLLGAVAGAACTRTMATLSPAPGTTTVAGIGDGARATAGGVVVTARAQAWQWQPTDLTNKVTPILLELENNGTQPILVRYNRIRLTDADGHRFAVMPPYDIDGTVSQSYTVENPFYGFNRFSIAPYLSRWYPRFSRYSGTFGYDASYYSPYVTRYRQIQLPTTDMVQRALPEGVLEPGGRAEGFVYFEALHRDAKTLTLGLTIVDANSGSVLGTADIPFVAH